MTKIFEIIGHNTFTIVVAMLVLGFLVYSTLNLFEKEIKAFLKKKFDMYDRFEVLDFARRYARKKSDVNAHLIEVDKELNEYNKTRNYEK